MGTLHETIVRERYGFTIANFSRTLPLGLNSFAFPTHCEQVFFSYDLERTRIHGGEWKVVYGTEVRGRRTDTKMANTEIDILFFGRDAQFEGLRVMQE